MFDLNRLPLHYDRVSWDRGKSVYGMLYWLKSQHPKIYRNLKPKIHRYLIANCECIWHLLPHKDSRLAIQSAKQWLVSEISDEEVRRRNYYVEAAAFMFDHPLGQEDFDEINAFIDRIPELARLDFESAREKLKDAAYLADKAMMFPFLRGGIWRWWSKKDYLLDPDLFRVFLPSVRVFKAIKADS